MPEMNQSCTSASLTMQTPKRLEDGSPVRPASYGVLAMAGYQAQMHDSPVRQTSYVVLATVGSQAQLSRDDPVTGPVPGRKTDGPPIQQGSMGRFLTPA